MFSKRYLLILVLMVALVSTRAEAAHYTGTLPFGNGLSGATAWDSAKLSWTVDDETNPGVWTYQYFFAVGAKEIGSIIIGTAKSVLSRDIKEGTTPGFELGTFGEQGASTPGIPREVYGMKWDVPGDSLVYSWRIVTGRAPMWGDFYARSGKHNKGGKDSYSWVFAHNGGFGEQHLDSPAADGNSGGWALVPGMTSHEHKVHLSAVEAFKKVRGMVAPGDTTRLKGAFVGNQIEISSANWTYVFDRAGYQVFRPVSLYPHFRATFATDIGPILEQWKAQPVPQKLVEQAKQVVQSVLGDVSGMALKAMPARELITSKKADSKTVRFHEGRTIVFFARENVDIGTVRIYKSSMSYDASGHPVIAVVPEDISSRSYEAAVTFAPGGGLIRVESSILTPGVQEIAATLDEGLARAFIYKRMPFYDLRLRFGSFYDPDENRFELNSYSYEGEKFLGNEDCDNPPSYPDKGTWWCDPDEWHPFGAVYPFTSSYRNGDAWPGHYRYWSWYQWLTHGQKNGIRGNWNETTQSWEHDIQVSPPKSLTSYAVMNWDSDPLPTSGSYSCDNIGIIHWTGTDRKLGASFYEDLERNHVALIDTHGGPINGIYQMRRSVDVWLKLHEQGDAGLGNGNLRHLFLETCAGMNWNNIVSGQPQNLFTDWMNWHVADGIRMVLGYDGMRSGHFWNGWLFFGSYHAGDSISQAWFNQAIETHPCNVPVAVAYGTTEDEALETLLDDRFTRSRGSAGWVVASEILPQCSP